MGRGGDAFRRYGVVGNNSGRSFEPSISVARGVFIRTLLLLLLLVILTMSSGGGVMAMLLSRLERRLRAEYAITVTAAASR